MTTKGKPKGVLGGNRTVLFLIVVVVTPVYSGRAKTYKIKQKRAIMLLIFKTLQLS